MNNLKSLFINLHEEEQVDHSAERTVAEHDRQPEIRGLPCHKNSEIQTKQDELALAKLRFQSACARVPISAHSYT